MSGAVENTSKNANLFRAAVTEWNLVSIAVLTFVVSLPGCRINGGPRPEVNSIGFSGIGADLELNARLRNLKQKIGAQETVTNEMVFNEKLGLATGGYVYHPKLLSFDASGRFGLEQYRFETDIRAPGFRTNEVFRDKSKTLEYDLTAHLLQEKKYPVMGFAKRYEGWIRRGFQPSLEVTNTSFGFEWRFVDDRIPSILRYENGKSREENRVVGADVIRRHDETLGFKTSYVFSEKNKLSFLYEHRSLDQEPSDFGDVDTDDIQLHHFVFFGPEAGHQLSSFLGYLVERGGFSYDRATWSEVLSLSHSERLRSLYNLYFSETINKISSGTDSRNRYTSLSGALFHKLYESLESSVNGFYSKQDVDSDLETIRYGFNGKFHYQKTNRYGSLLADYSLFLSRTESTGSGAVIPVIDERQTFNDPNPVILSHLNAIRNTIVITDVTSTVIYREGLDYTVVQVSGRTEIRRIVTGLIGNGQTVLIDYSYDAQGDSTVDWISQSIGIRQNFKFGLSPYYRLLLVDQKISSRTPLGPPEDAVVNIVGVEYHGGEFGAGAEYEDHDSTVTPFEAIRLRAEYSHAFNFGGTGRFGASWSETKYPDSGGDRKATYGSLDASYQQPIMRNMGLAAFGRYFFLDDTVTGDSRGMDIDLAISYRYRQMRIELTYDFTATREESNRWRANGVYLQFSRQF